MAKVVNFYMDDSGVRYPNRDPGKLPSHGHDWFALGGVLVKEEHEEEARSIHQEFCNRWGINTFLHSSEIRSKNDRFLWLRNLDKQQHNKFIEELYCIMRDAPVTGLACVVDRPGYNKRYLEAYRNNRWLLCKTAFSVVVERAAKYALSIDYKLRVAAEKCNKDEDRYLRDYYNNLKSEGMPFSSDNSSKYKPLSADSFKDVLYDFRLKAKTSPMTQFADLYLWPICIGGYHASNKTYARLMQDKKLLEAHLPNEAWASLATKYSCFDLVERMS